MKEAKRILKDIEKVMSQMIKDGKSEADEFSVLLNTKICMVTLIESKAKLKDD